MPLVQRQVTVQGVPVSVIEQGGGTPLVIVHGWQGDHRYMQADLEPAFERASGQWRRVYLDLPGHGGTPAPPWLDSQAGMVDFLLAFCDEVLPDEPFGLIGSSYGGYLALALLRSVPHRLRGVALLVPDLPGPDGSRDTPDHRTVVEAPEAFGDLAADEQWIPDRLVEQSRTALELIREHDVPAMRAADAALLERLEANYLLPEALQFPGEPFDRPSLVVTGRQDSTVGFRAAVALGLGAELPRATVATLDLGGHWLGRVERPELVRALVADWLDRLVRTGT